MSARLLLVEDEPDIRLIARAALARAGFAVVAAADGAEAITLATQEPFDLVVLDWMLPDVDGPAACARLKADPATAHLPIIFLTARSGAADLAQCAALGAIGCITKPFDPLTLGDTVKALWQPQGGDPPREAA